MMRSAPPGSNYLSLDQSQVLEPIQPLSHCRGGHSRRFTQLKDRPSTRLVKLLKELVVTLFHGHIRYSLGHDRSQAPPNEFAAGF